MQKLLSRRSGIVLIMVMSMVGSFSAQRGMFLQHGVDSLTAAIVPLASDLLTVVMASIISDKRVISGKGWAFFVMMIAGSGSVTANWLAGTNAVDKAAHIALVVFYLCGEFVNSKVKMRDEGEPVEVAQEPKPVVQETATEVTADEAASPDLPEAPVSPGAPTMRGEYGPRDPERGYAPSTVRAKRAKAKAPAKSAA